MYICTLFFKRLVLGPSGNFLARFTVGYIDGKLFILLQYNAMKTAFSFFFMCGKRHAGLCPDQIRSINVVKVGDTILIN